MKKTIILILASTICTLCYSQKELPKKDISQYILDHLSPSESKDFDSQLNHTKCLTPLLLAGLNNYEKLNVQAKKLIDNRKERPTFEGTEEIFTLDNFAYHYTTDGPGDESVDSADANQNGFPDYVDFVASIFTEATQFYHEFNGLALPPNDNEEHNGAYYDIYISGKAAGTGTYGFVQPEDMIMDNPNTSAVELDATTSFMVIRNNFDGFITVGPNAVRVTVAHEYLHAIQFGYFSINNTWLFEGSATFAEEWLYPGIDDNFQYLDDLFSRTDIAMNIEPGEVPEFDGFWYSSWVFFKHMTEHTANDIIIDILKEGVSVLALDAIETALQGYDRDFLESFGDYLVSLLVLNSSSALDPYDLDRAADYSEETGGLSIESSSTFTGDQISFNSAVDGDGLLMRLGADFHLIASNQNFRVDATVGNGTGEVIFALLKLNQNSGLINDVEIELLETNGVLLTTQVTDSEQYDFFVLAAFRGADTQETNTLDYEFQITSMTTTATKEISDENTFTLHPNPSSAFLTLKSENDLSSNLYYTLSDPLGQVFMNRSKLADDDRIDISLLPTGVYYMSISDKSGKTLGVQKMIKSEIR